MIPWFASFLIYNYVAKNNLLHVEYMKVLDKINSKRLFHEIRNQTYLATHKLINNTLFELNITEKKQLKNMGEFLGIQTLSRNQPITLNRLDLKNELCIAFEGNRLDRIIDLVTSVLKFSKNSKVFKRSNPWIQPIFSLLKELSERKEVS